MIGRLTNNQVPVAANSVRRTSANRPVRRPDLTIATEDHNVPTVDIAVLRGSNRWPRIITLDDTARAADTLRLRSASDPNRCPSP